MTETELRDGTAIEAGKYPAWRRRRYVVDARSQLRAGILVGSLTLGLLVLLNLSVFTGRDSGATSWALLITGSVVFFTGIVAIGILESHRTAGAAFAIRRTIDAVRDGQRGARVRLRRGDHLQELADAVNALAVALDEERRGRNDQRESAGSESPAS
ncbi:MAG TPA: hypothetical protein VFV19_03945 [Candidatus Polarisedimenticolaceae bacterium]|nr:hypothetical protein [Candidatus Polarisedimenticolaceae bacterium]